jgi:hypothetical protein
VKVSKQTLLTFACRRKSTAKAKAEEAESVAKKAIEDAQLAKEHASHYERLQADFTALTTAQFDNDSGKTKYDDVFKAFPRSNRL